MDLFVTGWALLVDMLPDMLALGVKIFGAAVLVWIYAHGVRQAPKGGVGSIAAGLAIVIVTCGYEAARWVPSALPIPEIYPLTRATLDGMEKLLILLLPLGLMHYWAAPAWMSVNDITLSAVLARATSLLVVLAISIFVPASIALQGEMQALKDARHSSLEELSAANTARKRLALESLMRMSWKQIDLSIKYCRKHNIECRTWEEHRKTYQALAGSLGLDTSRHLDANAADLVGAEAQVVELYKRVFDKDAKLPPEVEGDKRLPDPKAAPAEVWKRLRHGIVGDFVTPLSLLLVASHWTAFLLLVAGERRRGAAGVAR